MTRKHTTDQPICGQPVSAYHRCTLTPQHDGECRNPFASVKGSKR